jgi:hypothetical protein
METSQDRPPGNASGEGLHFRPNWRPLERKGTCGIAKPGVGGADRVKVERGPLPHAPAPFLSNQEEDAPRSGLRFACNEPIRVGTLVEIFLELPEEVSRPSSSVFVWHCRGEVVHVRPYCLPFGKSGAGVRFDDCQVERLSK